MKEGDIIMFRGEVGIIEIFVDDGMIVRFTEHGEHVTYKVYYLEYYEYKSFLKYAYHWCVASYHEHWDRMDYDDEYRFMVIVLCLGSFLLSFLTIGAYLIG